VWRALTITIALTIAALGATLLLQPRLDSEPSLLFVAAVALSTRFGGRWAGILASVLALLALDFYFVPPLGSIDLSEPRQIVHFALFLFVALLIGGTFDAERQARRDAETAAKAREEILGIVAHDLRNPINRLTNTAQLVAEVDDPAERDKLLGVARRAVQEINRLINDLLDTVRLRNGTLSMTITEVPCSALLHRAEEAFNPVSSEKGVRFSAHTDLDGLRVRADEGRAGQALGNLLGNAFKFTQRGGEVSLKAARVADQVRFDVSDTGPGLTHEQIEHVFDRFWQGRRGDARGVGLGLTITRAIVEAHGGRLWAESTPGRGSTFSFTLPVAGNRAS
jgi:signal transduction histidine kinase